MGEAIACALSGSPGATLQMGPDTVAFIWAQQGIAEGTVLAPSAYPSTKLPFSGSDGQLTVYYDMGSGGFVLQ
jgi:hypothetical protein